MEETMQASGQKPNAPKHLERRPFRPLKLLKRLLGIVVLCAVLGGACFLLGRNSARPKETAPQLDAVVLESQLSSISELASVTYSYTNMSQFTSSGDFYGVKIPFTTKSFILTYDGDIKAGIDLTGVQVDVQGDAVTVTLPKAAILSHEIDENSVEVFDEKTSIFNPFTVEDFTAFQADQKAAMEEKALSRGLLEEAQSRAEDSVRTLLVPVLPEGVTLTVTSADT